MHVRLGKPAGLEARQPRVHDRGDLLDAAQEYADKVMRGESPTIFECGLCGRRWYEEGPWKAHVAAMRERAERDKPVREWLEAQLRAMRAAWRAETCDAPLGGTEPPLPEPEED